MSILSRADVYNLVAQAGFSNVPYPGQNYSPQDEAVAIAFAESGGDTQHVHINGASTATINGQSVQVPSGTRDRGLFQINDWWNNGLPPPAGGGGPLVTDDNAFDPAWSASWVFRVTQGGNQGLFRAYFVTVQNGAWLSHLTPGGGVIPPTPQPPPPPSNVATEVYQGLIDFIAVLKKTGLV